MRTVSSCSAAHQGLAILPRRCRLRRRDEARADDDALRAERERGDDAAPVDDAARGDDRDLHRVDHLRHERERADLARVPAGLGALRGHHVGAGRFGADRVLHLARSSPRSSCPRRFISGDVLLRHGEPGDEDAYVLVEEHGEVRLDHLRNAAPAGRPRTAASSACACVRISARRSVGRQVRRPHDAEAAGVRHRRDERRHRDAAHARETDRHTRCRRDRTPASAAATAPGDRLTRADLHGMDSRRRPRWESRRPHVAMTVPLSLSSSASGQITDRPDDPRQGLEPLALMEVAARRALDDAGVARRRVVCRRHAGRRDERLPRLRRHRDACWPPASALQPRANHPQHVGRQHAAVAGEPPVRRDRGGPHGGRAAGGRRGVPHHARARQGGHGKPMDAAGRDRTVPRWGDARPGTSDVESRHGLREAYVTFALYRERVPRRARSVDLASNATSSAPSPSAARRIAAASAYAWFRDGKPAATLVTVATGEPHGRVPLPQVPERHHGGEPGRGPPPGERGGGASPRHRREPLGLSVGRAST